MLGRCGIELHVVGRGRVETQIASGYLVAGVEGIVAAHYRKAIGEKTRDALARLRAKGRKVSRWPPYGSRFGPGGRLLPEPAEQWALGRIAALKGVGLSLRKISQALAAEGIVARNGRPFAAKVLRTLVTNRGRLVTPVRTPRVRLEPEARPMRTPERRRLVGQSSRSSRWREGSMMAVCHRRRQSDPVPTAHQLLGLVAMCVALLLAGCTTLTPLQQARLQDARDITARTTALYGAPGVRVFADDHGVYGASAVYATQARMILLPPALLESPFMIAVLAHELGHVTLGHDMPIVLGGSGQGVSADEYRRAAQRRELDANRRAVEVMVRVLGLEESRALRRLGEYLVATAEGWRGRMHLLPWAHIDPCDQWQALLDAFPSHRSWASQQLKCESRM